MAKNGERQPVIVIRRANFDDRKAIDDIRTCSIQGLATTHYSPEQIESWSANKQLEKYPVETEYMVVALVDGVIAGYGDLRLKSNEVRAVYVDANYARQGVGSAILRNLEETAYGNGLTDLHLGASLNAVGFYESHRYAVVKRDCKMTVTGVEAPYTSMAKILPPTRSNLLKILTTCGLGMSRETVILKHHNPEWRNAATTICSQLKNSVGHGDWHHVGSTSIPNISAKPILDVLGVVDSIEAFDSFKTKIEGLGFTWKGEYGIEGRRYSVLYGETEKFGFIHLHVFGKANPEVEKHLLFRDYLIEHPDAAQEYEENKRQLAERFGSQRENYTNGKSALISELLKRAFVWHEKAKES